MPARADDPKQLNRECSAVRDMLEDVAGNDQIAAVVGYVDLGVRPNDEFRVSRTAGRLNLVRTDKRYASPFGGIAEDPAEAADIDNRGATRKVSNKLGRRRDSGTELPISLFVHFLTLLCNANRSRIEFGCQSVHRFVACNA